MNKMENIDYSKLDNNELLKIGFKMMRAYKKDKNTKDHIEYEKFLIELERRQIKLTT
jgi:hypothetical protein